jgi:hypothetical protein
MKGSKPQDLKIEKFDRTEIVVNLKAAHDLGLHVDASRIKDARIINGVVETNNNGSSASAGFSSNRAP